MLNSFSIEKYISIINVLKFYLCNRAYFTLFCHIYNNTYMYVQLIFEIEAKILAILDMFLLLDYMI